MPLDEPLQVSTFKKLKQKGNEDQEAGQLSARVLSGRYFCIHRNEGRPILQESRKIADINWHL
jgi:hypothetical protein